jgi:signal transduction histidine kinase
VAFPLLNHLEVVYFVYGLAFFSMAVAIYSQTIGESRFKLAHILWLLGGFGLFHGVNEWLDGWELLHGRMSAMDISRLAILSVSFLFLFEFGRQLFRLQMEQYPVALKKIAGWLTWILAPLIVALISVLSAFTHDLWESGGIEVRHFLAFPSGLLIGAGFFLYYHYEESALEPLKVKKHFWGAGLSFLAYGVLAGLVVPKGHYGLSAWLNTESFLSLTHIPVQVFRTGCAIVAGWSAINLLKIFNLEIIKKLDGEVVWRKQAEGELARINEKLLEVNQRKSDFVANVSHELKNPLGVIRESMVLILDKFVGEVSPEQKEILEMGKRNVERLIRLVSDLLDLTKIEAGEVELKREEIDPGVLVKDVLKSYEREISKKRFFFREEIHSSAGVLWGDHDKLTEVIINLLSNAIKYTPEAGNITVKLEGNEKELRFEIADSGPGIPEDYREKIFDKFTRITMEKQEGTGLGLPIAREIIELHKGKMWVESEIGKGSRFIFTIPRDFRVEIPHFKK